MYVCKNYPAAHTIHALMTSTNINHLGSLNNFQPIQHNKTLQARHTKESRAHHQTSFNESRTQTRKSCAKRWRARSCTSQSKLFNANFKRWGKRALTTSLPTWVSCDRTALELDQKLAIQHLCIFQQSNLDPSGKHQGLDYSLHSLGCDLIQQIRSRQRQMGRWAWSFLVRWSFQERSRTVVRRLRGQQLDSTPQATCM